MTSWALVLGALVAGCADLRVAPCRFRCDAEGQCPVGTCDQDGFCRSDEGGERCAAAYCTGCVDEGPYNHAFVTSTTYTLATVSGVADADEACRMRAEAGGLPGTFKAWLGTAGAPADARLVTAGGQAARGWVRPDRRPFADSVDQLDGHVLYPLRLDEQGRDLDNGGHVFVMTRIEGTGTYTAGDATCGGECWNDGYPGLTAAAHLYCFGVDQVRPLAIATATGRVAFLSNAELAPGSGDADAMCQGEARARGLPGDFLALLSTTTTPASARFSAGTPWVRADGIVWAESIDELARGNVLTALSIEVTGAFVRTASVWTGAGAPGETSAAGADCGGWAAASGSAMYGLSSQSNVPFYGYATTSCAEAHRLYCLER